MSSNTTRAIIYGRVSTKNGQDIQLQVDDLRAAAAQRRWSVVGEHLDDGISGAVDERPGLGALMQAVRSGRVDVVMCWRFDRFARSTNHLLRALEEFRQLGVAFFSLREQIDSTTHLGKALFTIVAAISELERDIIQERVQAGVARAREKGVKFGRPRVELDLRAAHLLLAQGRSVRQVADLLSVPRSTLRRRLAEIRESGGPEVCAPRHG